MPSKELGLVDGCGDENIIEKRKGNQFKIQVSGKGVMEEVKIGNYTYLVLIAPIGLLQTNTHEKEYYWKIYTYENLICKLPPNNLRGKQKRDLQVVEIRNKTFACSH